MSVGVIVSHVSRCLSVAEFVGSQVRVARRPVVLARTQPSYRLSRFRAFLSCRPGSWLSWVVFGVFGSFSCISVSFCSCPSFSFGRSYGVNVLKGLVVVRVDLNRSAIGRL